MNGAGFPAKLSNGTSGTTLVVPKINVSVFFVSPAAALQKAIPTG